MEEKRPPLTPFWIIAFAMAGIGDTLYLSWHALQGTLPTCSIIKGCDVVLSSQYAKVFGVPLAYIGLVFYIYLFCLALLLAYEPYSKGLRFGMLAYATIGLLCSAVFAYMWVFLIHALCIYCLTSAIITLIVFCFSLWHFTATKQR